MCFKKRFLRGFPVGYRPGITISGKSKEHSIKGHYCPAKFTVFSLACARQPGQFFRIWSRSVLVKSPCDKTAGQMPFVVRSDSENEAELVFLSPDEEVSKPQERGQGDQGASPVLWRSNRKRKSVMAYSETDMSKGSGSEKRKAPVLKKCPK